jgi:very-short-patch-repair endonuclease
MYPWGNTNPMKRPEIAKKVSDTLKGKHDELSDRAKKQWENGILKPHAMSKENKTRQRLLMIANNPMFNKETASKVHKTLKKQGYGGHKNKGRKRLDFSEYLIKNNPMKNPEIVKIIVEKKTQNGYYQNTVSKLRRYNKHPSRPQVKLSQKIKEIYPEVEIEYPIKTENQTIFLDIAIPSKKVDIEYDGKEWHKNKARDEERDKILMQLGWKVIRTEQDDVTEEILNGIKCI